MDRMLDKRKARDKDSDLESDNTDKSNKNPTKRARVDFSSSPKEKSPSPASAQKSPLGKGVVDSITAATPAPSLSQKSSSSSNGDPAMASGGNPPVISFALPSPFTTQELEQLDKNTKVKEDSDSDSESTKFFSEIMQNEQRKRGERGSVPAETGRKNKRNGTSTNSKRETGTSAGGKSSGRAAHPVPIMGSSPKTDLSSLSEVEVTIKISDPGTHKVILEETNFKSDFQRMDGFLRQHNLKLSTSSLSGYSADVSSLENSGGIIQGSSSSNRWTISSLGSTIPRESRYTIGTETSASPEEAMARMSRPPVSKSRKRSEGPILTSTKVEEDTSRSSSGAGMLDRMNVSGNPTSNGDDYSPSEKSQPSRNSELGKLKKGTMTPSSTPNNSRKSKGTPKGLTVSVAVESTEFSYNSDAERSDKKPGSRRRVGSASNFPVTSAQTSAALSAVLNTPPPVRSVAKIEGTSAKPLTRFEEEMNNEAVVEPELQKGATLWSTILTGELVFARWRDKNYYSGMVKSKGHNDTWIIDFDDGMEDVASESHIVPIRILGVGIKGIYSPDTGYEPHMAEVIGQKFGKDPDTSRNIVKYAIKYHGGSKPIWCSRRQLSIKEVDAKKLRAEYQPPVIIKAGDVSLDNIVEGSRRRTRGGAESEGKAIVAGAFDVSIAEKSSPSVTPATKGRKTMKKTPASESRKKQVAAGSQHTKEAPSSPPKKDSAKESPSRSQKQTGDLSKKRSKKILFQGMQFFLTASGGGDPGINGNPMVPPVQYDKDEYRELIESCGGTIVDSVGDEGEDNVFLISDSYARTVKYIYCLAAGIPCVSHTWIKTCLDQNEIVQLDVFQLPAGWSLEHQDLIPHHDRKPLKGCKIFVTSESDQLYNYWKPVLTAADATLLKPSKKKGTIPAGTEVVVTDNSPKDVLDEAGTLNLPVVKPEWLVQTIITGEKAHIYGHDKYKVLNDTESEETEDTTDGPSHFNEVLANMQSPD